MASKKKHPYPAPKYTNVEVPNLALTPVSEILKNWMEINNFFSKKTIEMKLDDEKVKLSIDLTDIVHLFSTGSDDDIPCENRRKERISKGLHQYGSTIRINNLSKNINEQIWERAVYRVLQQLYLTVNLSYPGILSIAHSYHYFKDLEVPLLSCDYIFNNEHDWPEIYNLNFKDVWDWFEIQKFCEIDTSVTSCQKGLFSLLKISNSKYSYEDTIPAIAQALESILQVGSDNIGKILKERMSLILGEPKTSTKWFAKFYSLRSRIVHGDGELYRPGVDIHNDPWVIDNFDKNEDLVFRATNVLIALMQILIMNKATRFEFETTYKFFSEHKI